VAIDAGALAAFGPFFAVTTPHTGAPTSPWLLMSDLVVGGGPLADRIAQVRAALATSAGTEEMEFRFAASVTQLGLTARLVAPVLGLAVLTGFDPVIDLGDVWWQVQLGGPFPLSLSASIMQADAAAPDGPAASPETCLHAFLDGPALELVSATLRAVPVAPHVLWGNLASAIYSAGQLAASARPELAARAAAVVDGALAHPRLATAHDRPDGRFRRRSCCLIYRIAGNSADTPRRLCGDCALIG
jgi:hypothetical protein